MAGAVGRFSVAGAMIVLVPEMGEKSSEKPRSGEENDRRKRAEIKAKG